ncbi:MAG: hypothetical protein IJA54_04600 [Tyzzerella sp.]|nr:hypothetical protein [Tyzzerella sp.]
MEQNKQYLYEYRNGRRARNLGFLKIEESMNKSVVHIYANEIDDVVGIVFRRDSGEKYTAGWEDELFEVEEEPSQNNLMLETTMQVPTTQVTPQEPIEEQEREIEEYITPRNVTYEKIQRQGLSRLPRREWRIANNSFLLHGFYNYHHLLYIEEDGNVLIGVPGIFHEKEQEAASAFGFPKFRRLTNNEIQLEENEKNTYEDFGYWCRQIPKG